MAHPLASSTLEKYRTTLPILTTFDRTHCNIVVVEIGFCQDFGCDKKTRQQDPKKSLSSGSSNNYKYSDKVELIAIAIGYVGTTLKKT